jgi:Rhodopirellula transposase DDE domain
LSTDSKAVVKLGPLSRDGKSRVPTDASDHDHDVNGVIVPVGILLPEYQELWIYMVTSKATADCLVDVTEMFWQENRHRFPEVTRLVVTEDNGPENNSHRTQYIQRMVEFADEAKVDISLAYYPPYHSKYNPIERCWGVLENCWNGSLIDTVEAAVGFAQNMTWCGKHPIVRLVTKVYEKGKKVAAKVMRTLEETRLRRDEKLGRWFVDIVHQP